MWVSLVLISAVFISGTMGQGQSDPVIKFYSFEEQGIDGDLQHRLHKDGIKEGIKQGTYIGTLKAYVSEDRNGVLEYETFGKYLVVDGSTGMCNTSSTDFDFEHYTKNPNEYAVEMQATYKWSGRSVYVRTSFKITILDINDNAPEFIKEGSTYDATVSENAPIDTIVSKDIQATDKDTSFFAHIRFKCYIPSGDANSTEVAIATEACEYFGVRTTKVSGEKNYIANIFTKKKLDYETIPIFAMSIIAYDDYENIGGVQLSTSANIQIRVDDEQDRNPVFKGANAKIFVQEHTPVGTKVGNDITVSDGDTGARRQLAFKIQDFIGHPEDAFDLRTTKNDNNVYVLNLVVKKDLDRENLAQTSTYTFKIVATELDTNGSPTSDLTEQSIDVSILDINDNAPLFDKAEYKIDLPEPSKPAILPGLSLLLQDADGASFNSYSVSIVNQTYKGTFSLNAETGSGRTALYFEMGSISRLDFDTSDGRYRKQEIQLVAVDKDKPSLQSTAKVIITLLDENDNDPIFNPTTYSPSVLETAPIGTTITTIIATDLDSGSNGKITFNLPAHTDVFNLDPNTGVITLKKKLDFETTPRYDLFPTAQDNGLTPNRADAEVVVTVLNVNDDGPQFQQASYSSLMDEKSQTLAPQITVSAVDTDGDTVTYQIISGNVRNGFAIDRTTGKVSVTRNDLTINDAIDKSYFKLRVRATDSGSPAQIAETDVTVTIRDINDNAPEFNATLYEKTLSEIEKPGNSLLQVFATDKDTGSNAQIKYEIESGSRDHFVIDPNSGVVTMRPNAVLNYDDAKLYDIVVNAVDNGSPPFTGETRIKITLTDANNQLPVFKKDVYNQNLRENAAIGSNVIQVEAVDPDTTRKLQYSLITSSMRATSKNAIIFIAEFNYQEVFSMNKDNGWITVAKSLDYENDWVVEFEVQVTDINAENPKPQISKAQVIISVANIADPRPIFEYPWTRNKPLYEFPIDEGLAVGTNLTTLIAREPDKSKISNYEKVAGSDPGGYFNVNRQTGVISLRREIDYEVMNDRIPVMLGLAVMVVSPASKLSATATVSYKILDVNDNKPEFGKKAYRFSIFENLAYPGEVGTVFASDADSGTYKVFVFFLSGPFSENFAILPQINTGESQITVAQGVTLDYETTKEYKFVLHARNPNDRSSDNQVDLEIILKDVNDNTPQFTKAAYSFYCLETQRPNRLIDIVSATDRDAGANQVLTYVLNDDGPGKGLFFIDSTNGRMYVKSELEGTSYKSPYVMSVTVYDNGSPRLSNTTTVNVTVSSGHEDKGLPVFTNPSDTNTTISILENVPINYVVITAAARPKTPGASVRFFFQANSAIDSVFSISPSGVITVISELDREKKDSYDMIISAVDTLNSTRVSARKITIRILDVNDNQPSFTSCPNRKYEKPEVVTITEGIRVGSFVYRALACDLDLPPHNGMKYRFFYNQGLCVSSIQNHLTLDVNTGELRTKVIVDREVTPTLYACIEVYAVTGAGRRKRATPDNILEVRINVLDINDKGPVFMVGDLTEIIFDLPKKDSVAQVRAEDKDSSFYNKVRYSIYDIMYYGADGRTFRGHNAFNINPDTGELTVSFTSYKAFLKGYFNITVKAEDFYKPSLFDLTSVKVYVGEELYQVRVVTDTDYTKDIASIVTNMLNELHQKHPNAIFKDTQIRYHKDVSGAYIADKTDVCMLVVRNNAILDSYDGQNLLDSESQILNKYGFSEDGMCEPATSRLLDGDYILWWVVVALAIFMFIIICILIGVLRFLYKDYRQFMDTRQQYLVPIQQ